ncbi:MAG: adenosylcobinamide-GDP ribazoletransferase [Thermodesulfovibrionales bacterium]
MRADNDRIQEPGVRIQNKGIRKDSGFWILNSGFRSLLLSLQFLTIIPVRVKGTLTEREMAGSAAFFPVAGLVQGIIAALIALPLLTVFPPAVVSGIVLICLTLTNGGFHLDGLADTFDGLAVKSSGDAERDREKRLAVMKDSTTGAIGMVAVVLTLLLKYQLITLMLTRDLGLLCLMPLFSRWAMVPPLYHGVSARKDGLGRIFIGHMGVGTVVLSTIVVLAVSGIALSFGKGSAGVFISMLPILYGFSLLAAGFFRKRFGGITGDNLGAISEASEIIYLLVGYIWLQQSI